MSTPPNQTGKKFPDRKSAINTPIPDAIHPRTAEEFIEELLALESPDVKQIRKHLNTLFNPDLDKLTRQLAKLRNAIYEIRYDRSPKGIARKAARKNKET